MPERTGDFEWRAEGEGAEVLLYAADGSAVEDVLPATRLPGVENPIYAAASIPNLGWVAASTTHAAPALVSAPARGLLISTNMFPDDLDVPEEEIVPLLLRNLSEVSLPRLDGSGVRRICEAGAWAAAEDGFIEEDDLPFFHRAAGDPDSLGRRALSAGEREWDVLTKVRACVVEEVLDSLAAENLDLPRGSLVLEVESGAGDLCRLALATHEQRILSRIRAGLDLGAEDDLPAAPLGSEEAADTLAAAYAGANFADGRCARTLYALRRALADATGGLRAVASWEVGGFEEFGSSALHRRGLARTNSGAVLVSGDSVAAGTGAMLQSAPPFEAAEVEGVWPWEEAGLLGRLATLKDLEPRNG
ncbi:MAG: hypothetical protein ACFB50_05505 [Rubrobacteraceae bacterium]